MSETEYQYSLPVNYQLQEYQVQSILGAGGFGITYLAMDVNLSAKVAIKEYFPGELVTRQEGYTVHTKLPKYKEDFHWGLERFIQEAKILAQLKHPNIVRVLRFLQANETAYLVMEYEEGDSLSALLTSGDKATEEEVRHILLPLTSGLAQMHQRSILHRDIKPANIYIRSDNSPVLLDFGSARYDVESRSRSVTAIVTPGYAPFEQYESKAAAQGPWTDIYALGAVAYRLISGETPVEAPERIGAMMRGNPDPLIAAVKVGQRAYTQSLLKAIDWALKVNEKERPQSVSAWNNALLEGIQTKRRGILRNVGISSLPTVSPPVRQTNPLRFWLILLLLICMVGVGWAISDGLFESVFDNDPHVEFPSSNASNEEQLVEQPPEQSQPEVQVEVSKPEQPKPIQVEVSKPQEPQPVQLTDLQIIEQLEREIGKELEQISLDKVSLSDNGYAVDENNYVIGLNLDKLELSTIPNALIELKNLQKLSLYDNKITELPASFGQLQNLSYLSLYNNQLQELPASFGQLQNLSTLHLSDNQLKELPASFGQLQNLSDLSLSSNQLKELPASFGQLQNLSYLSLSGNQLKELPASFGQLQNLSELILYGNQLQELPASFGQLQNLSKLGLSGNQLKELPAWFGQLKNLSDLSLYNNQLQELPASFGQLKNLSELYLYDNQLKELPASFGQLQNLSYLSLSDNQLKELPKEILDLNLEILWKTGYIEEGSIAVGDNPFEIPPIAVIKQGNQAIRRYFEQDVTD